MVWAFALFRFRLLELMPVARDALIERMDDAAIVVDAGNAIIYCNPTARALFGSTAEQVAEQALEPVPPGARERAERAKREIRVELRGQSHSFDVHVSLLLHVVEPMQPRLSAVDLDNAAPQTGAPHQPATRCFPHRNPCSVSSVRCTRRLP
jgi:PAS domain-containing protein